MACVHLRPRLQGTRRWSCRLGRGWGLRGGLALGQGSYPTEPTLLLGSRPCPTPLVTQPLKIYVDLEPGLGEVA